MIAKKQLQTDCKTYHVQGSDGFRYQETHTNYQKDRFRHSKVDNEGMQDRIITS
jgi:hypothetical protein